FCLDNEEESLSDDDFAHGCRLVEALGRHPAELSERVLAILRGESDASDWMQVFVVRLAGEMKLEAAVPLLIDVLTEPDDSEAEECLEALVKIGTEKVIVEVATVYPRANWDFWPYAAALLEDLHTDLSVQTALSLSAREEEPRLQAYLLTGILRSFAS